MKNLMVGLATKCFFLNSLKVFLKSGGTIPKPACAWQINLPIFDFSDNTYIYSQLDPAARKINAAKFKLGTRKTRVLIVTDLAARGIDVPLLDNVINYHFPAKSKLFVHR